MTGTVSSSRIPHFSTTLGYTVRGIANTQHVIWNLERDLLFLLFLLLLLLLSLSLLSSLPSVSSLPPAQHPPLSQTLQHAIRMPYLNPPGSHSTRVPGLMRRSRTSHRTDDHTRPLQNRYMSLSLHRMNGGLIPFLSLSHTRNSYIGRMVAYYASRIATCHSHTSHRTDGVRRKNDGIIPSQNRYMSRSHSTSTLTLNIGKIVVCYPCRIAIAAAASACATLVPPPHGLSVPHTAHPNA
eukprot:2797699-Rhodomonas_salina.1